MDFLDEAKEILRKQVHAGLFDENEIREEIRQALLRSHRQGQEEMRERAAKEIEPDRRLCSMAEEIWRAGCAEEVRAVPLTPIEEDKSVAEKAG